jgi:hypothetical protein
MAARPRRFNNSEPSQKNQMKQSNYEQSLKDTISESERELSKLDSAIREQQNLNQQYENDLTIKHRLVMEIKEIFTSKFFEHFSQVSKLLESLESSIVFNVDSQSTITPKTQAILKNVYPRNKCYPVEIQKLEQLYHEDLIVLKGDVDPT